MSRQKRFMIMMKKVPIKNLIGIMILVVFTGILFVFGYKVVVTADEAPGKLSSVPIAANKLMYAGTVMKDVQKISYEEMKYGFVDDLLLAKMDVWDRQYEQIRLEEVRAINNLTAMDEKTTDKLAYKEAKDARDAYVKQAREAALAAERAKEIQRQIIAARLRNEEYKPRQSNHSGSVSSGSGDTASKGGRQAAPVYATSKGKCLGKFVITAYCTCRICCGVYSGRNRTASGTVPTANRTIAVDTNVIPFGTRVIINGQVYVAEDRGGAIKGNRIDMFFMTHQEALRWGRKTMEVYLAD